MKRVGRGHKRPLSPKQAAWVRSVEFRAAARRGLALSLQTRAAAKRCGARAKSTGAPCRALALANGRCNAHGGKTPKNDQWHRVQIGRPPSRTGLEKIERKLAKREVEVKAREKRLAAMTPEQLKRHDRWQQTHAPGGPAERARRRRQCETKGMLEDLQRASMAREAADALRRLAAETDNFRTYRDGVFG